jgi:hypothetical protein
MNLFFVIMSLACKKLIKRILALIFLVFQLHPIHFKRQDLDIINNFFSKPSILKYLSGIFIYFNTIEKD